MWEYKENRAVFHTAALKNSFNVIKQLMDLIFIEINNRF